MKYFSRAGLRGIALTLFHEIKEGRTKEESLTHDIHAATILSRKCLLPQFFYPSGDGMITMAFRFSIQHFPLISQAALKT